MKRIVPILIFASIILLSAMGCVLAFEDNQSYTCEETNFVYVSGNLGENFAGSNVTLLLTDSNSGTVSPEYGDIGYMNQTQVKSDGSYEFRFKFSGFEFDSNGNVSNYILSVNHGGEKITGSISNAIVYSQMYNVEWSFSQANNIINTVASIYNKYKLNDNYVMLLSFYSGNDILLSTKFVNGSISGGDAVGEISADTPPEATKAKAFIWRNINSMLPMCDAETVPVESEFSVNSENVRFVGRTAIGSYDSVNMNWPQSGIEFEFTGTKAEVYIDLTNIVYLNTSVDGSEDCNRTRVYEGWNVIAENLEYGKHTIRLTRSSEAVDGLLSISKVKLYDTTYIAPTIEKVRKMEFIGDSYTVGYGNIEFGANTTTKNAENTDAWRSYTGYAMRALNADANIVAFSGKGVCMNCISIDATSMNTANTMTKQYLYSEPVMNSTFPYEEWDFSKYTPQVVVVYLGANDYNGTGNNTTPSGRGSNSEYFYGQYYNFLSSIRSRYPNASIIACSNNSGTYEPQVASAVTALGGGNNRYYHMIFNKFGNSGVNGHPYYTQDQNMAQELFEYINTIDNVWD